jgi:transcription-repair coupling factor (superfamily II helicase)
VRSLLVSVQEDAALQRLAADGGHAYVSSALRPCLLAALAETLAAGARSAVGATVGARASGEGGAPFDDYAARGDGPLAVESKAMLVVVGDDRAARDMASELGVWLAPRTVRYYPSRGVAYESHLIPPPHLVGLRLAALDALLASRAEHSGRNGSARETGAVAPPAPPVVVISAAALSEKVPDPSLRPSSFMLRAGQRAELEECAERLAEAGYERVDQVEERGQFAVRGGLLDVFAVTAEHAVRLDFFGDEVESMRWFSTFSQRSLGETPGVEIAPAAELAAEHRELIAMAGEARREGEAVPDIEELVPVERFVAPLDLLGYDDVEVVVAAEEELAPALEDQWSDASSLGAAPDGAPPRLYLSPADVSSVLERRCRVWLSALAADQPIEFRAQAAQAASPSLAKAEGELERLVRSGYRAVVAFPQRGEGERAAYNLARLHARWLRGPSQGGGDEPGAAAELADEELPREPSLIFVQASLREGFVAPQWKLAVFPEHRLIARRRAAAPGPGGALRTFADLRTGDIVVHEDHGVARFAGFQTRTVAEVTRDYLYLEYQGDDRVWVPTDQLAKITRYVSAAGAAAGAHPPLSKLGGRRWESLKARARRAAQELAGELLALYAERARRPGHAFGEDSDWQRELEARFPYTVTADQFEAIELVKADMEAPRPMDRLICGDVGYGKTEVALRAAFKAATEGKQVLFLAPTTILVQQHYGNFSERLADYPIMIDQVSRLRPAATQREVLKTFAKGGVDILIGTHRLLSQDVRAKDLGLLIVDEEQRFGVKQKEMLRALKLSVDVISMSATPIPRTLQMSLSGLRDISVIETPPEGRRPVKTYVGEYDEDLVKAAIEREHARAGQTFFLHNRVETIDETAERLRALCPGLRVAVAHGQMDEGQLERVMMEFLRGQAEVLVCTSIIESGLDIPQANTLVVEAADRFGLAQLYQIRGRVGRRRERAYAYLLYDSAAALSADAAQRLAALSDHTELGSGFALAMRDLEIRGAGDLLGDEQSGHVAALGFELYLQMLQEAVAQAEAGGAGEEEGREPGEAAREPVRLDVKVDAYVPADYVPYERAKIEIHRRVAQAGEVADLELLRTELEDRFGPLPEPVENMLALARARIKFGLAGARAISFRGDRLAVSPIELDSSGAKLLRQEVPDALYESGRSQVTLRVPPDGPERFPAVVHLADVLLSLAGSLDRQAA